MSLGLSMKRYFVPLAAVIMALAATRLVARSSGRDDPRIDFATDDPHGRDADRPEAIPARGMVDVFWRGYQEVSKDRVSLIAAGVTFYLFLALFPALGAIVALYGLAADRATMAQHIRDLAVLLPPGAFGIVADQIQELSKKPGGSLGIAFFASFAIALWSAHNGTLALFDAMNVAYEEDEKRTFVRRNLIGLAFTLGATIAVFAMIGLVAGLPIVLSYVWLGEVPEEIALMIRWPVLLAIFFCGIVALYRFGPSREPAKVRWMTWGAAMTTFACVGMSLCFSLYLDRFADYKATYGALGALIGLLVWSWLSVTILIVGAELNAELEHQTARDTTTGAPLPMGARGAFVADSLGKSSGHSG
ncbi:YihY/virulence factor BrkB family protein [Rhizobium sp. SIMBA_035]